MADGCCGIVFLQRLPGKPPDNTAKQEQ